MPGRLSSPGLASGLVGPDAMMTFLKVAALFRVALVNVATLLRVGRSCALEAEFSRAKHAAMVRGAASSAVCTCSVALGRVKACPVSRHPQAA